MAKIMVILGDNGQGKTRYLLDYYHENFYSKHMAVISNSLINPFLTVEKNTHHYYRVKSKGNLDPFLNPQPISDYFVELIKNNSLRGMLNLCKLIGYSDKIVVRREPIYKIRSSDDYKGIHEYEIVYSSYAKKRQRVGNGFLRPITEGVAKLYGEYLGQNRDFHFNYEGGDDSAQDFRDHLKEESKLSAILGFRNNKPLFLDSVFVNKYQNYFQVEQASSGETYMLSLGLFLSKFLKEKTHLPKVILIDEPENSLHPKWQRKYIEFLMGYLGYNDDADIIIATHSPFITMETDFYNASFSLFNIENNKLYPAVHKHKNNNIEQVYYELFGVLTPKNRYLSEYCSNLVRDFAEGKVSYNHARKAIKGMRDAAFDQKQYAFLSDVLALLEKVHGDLND